MNISIPDLFALKQNEAAKPTGNSQQPQPINEPVINPQNILPNETYNAYGVRMGGSVAGNNTALSTFIQKIYLQKKQEQSKNQALQQELLKQQQKELDQEHTNLEGLEQKLKDINDKIEQNDKDLDTLKSDNKEKTNKLVQEQDKLKLAGEDKNKQAWTNRLIGLIVLVPITIYLLVFYSSTFYSAFFRNPENLTDVFNAMLDPQAYSYAWQGGIGEFLFCVLGPMIFMGLGLLLHVFQHEEGKAKWFKIPMVVIVTLMFDMILAYKIGEQLHSLAQMTGAIPLGESYTIDAAIHDVNTWAVIFLGFISYMIWGFIFDMVMQAHHSIDNTAVRIKQIKKEIERLSKQVDDSEQATKKDNDNLREMAEPINQQIIASKGRIKQLTSNLSQTTLLDFNDIKSCITQFFSGWQQELSLLGMPQSQQDQAKQIFDNQMATLFLP